MKISFAVCVHNEGSQFRDLIDRLSLFIHSSQISGVEYEIVIINDYSTDVTTIEALNTYKEDITVYSHALNGDYSAHKNFMNSKCTGDWIFNLDADEFVTDDVLEFIPHLLDQNPEIEAYWVPRINKVDGLTMKHVQKWLWTISKFDNHRNIKYINPTSEEYNLIRTFGLIIEEDINSIVTYYDPIISFPDYQMRLYKNSPNIQWYRPVHEQLQGFTKFGHLPQDPEFAIRHYKSIERQERQNNFYNLLLTDKKH